MSKRVLKNRKWPENCIWPAPIWDGVGGMPWEADDFMPDELDEGGQELLEIREYFDSLVEEGRLNEDYSLNEDYEDWDTLDDRTDMDAQGDEDDEDDEDEPDTFVPEIGEDYWDDGFDVYGWEEEFANHVNLLKITPCDTQTDPVSAVRRIIGYEFINENLMRQAFTRRAFAVQYGIDGCSEELEFLGDAVLGMIVTKEIVKQLMTVDTICPEAPFRAVRHGYDEGVLSKIRSSFISKEYLAGRAEKLGLDKYVLYGSGEEPTESSREDMMEALIGAVAVDSGWNQEVLEGVVDRLLCIQLTYPDRFLKETHYDLFNAWHQKHFGCMPEYEIYPLYREGSKSGPVVHTERDESQGFAVSYRGRGRFGCSIRFFVPDNDKGVRTSQRFDVDGETRSEAREEAAWRAYGFVVSKGLWVNLKDAGLIPDLENSINQLQELYQKKYFDKAPEYTFEPWHGDEWNCECVCGGVNGFGRGVGKTKAKKKAAYMVLVRLLKAAGICEESWEKKMWEGFVTQS